ncbi:hypothetical protein IFM89_006985 [Coptis chinensis]|uniref:Uncharacterized protein n=1 Tax=Coptis chinensis TaxID=261450 RepID=A0A835HDC0_9MAGN|nr:hypothetical protein IFM89_006985 [Coptis chinensis]
MSSASAQPSKVNQPSSTVATASPNEDHGGNGSSTFPARISCQRDAYPSGWFAGSNGIENLMNFNSTSSDTPQDNEEHATRLPTDGSTLGITIACVLPEEGRNGSCDGSLDDALSMAHDGCMSSALAMAPIMEVNQPSRMVATAPDEDQVGNDSFTFPARTSFKSEVDSSRWFNGPKGIENLKNLDPTSSDTPQDNEEQVAILPKDDPTGVIRESVLPGLLDGSSDGSPDDVLAVAHGGLMSSASAQATTINQSLSTVATASSNENHGGNDSVTFPARTSCQRDADSSRWFAGPNGNLDPTSSDSPRDTEEEATRFPTDDSTVGVVPGPVHPVEGSDRDLQDWLTSVTGPVLPVEGSDRDLQDWLTSVTGPVLPVEGSDRDLQDWLTSVTGPVLPVEGSDRDLQDWLTSVVDPELYYSSW